MSTHGPVRLDPDLMEQATREAKRQHRSTRKQIEFWVELGRAVEGVVTREQVAGLRSGLLAVMAPDVGPADVDEVFAELEERRPILAGQVTRVPVRYQASRTHPGFLERIDLDGRVTVGQFEQGEFQPRRRGETAAAVGAGGRRWRGQDHVLSSIHRAPWGTVRQRR